MFFTIFYGISMTSTNLYRVYTKLHFWYLAIVLYSKNPGVLMDVNPILQLEDKAEQKLENNYIFVIKSNS